MNRLRILLFASATLALATLAPPSHASEVIVVDAPAHAPPMLPVVVRIETPAPKSVVDEAPQARPEPRPVAWSVGLRAFARR